MNLRTLPLPAVFVAFAVVAPVLTGTFLAVRTGSPPSGTWDHPRPVTFILLGALALGMGVLGTVLEARRRKQGRPHEESRYGKAIRTGEISGDVSGWSDRVRRQLRFEAVGWIGVAYLLWLGVLAVVNGPRWAAVAVLTLAAVYVWSQWQSRRRLKTLLKDLSSQHVERADTPSP